MNDTTDPFSFQRKQDLPRVEDQISETLATIRCRKDNTPVLIDFMEAALAIPAEAKSHFQLEQEWLKAVGLTLLDFKEMVISARGYPYPYYLNQHDIPETFYCALAMRNLPLRGIRGMATLHKKQPKHLPLLNEAFHISEEFLSLNAERIPSKKTFDRLGRAAQFLTELHAVQLCVQAIKSSLGQKPFVPVLAGARVLNVFENVSRYRPLISASRTDIANHFKGLLLQVDAHIATHNPVSAGTCEIVSFRAKSRIA